MPRSAGGRATADVHPICHRKVHSILSEREIAESYATMDALRGHPEIAAFVKWIARRPPDFHRRTRKPRRR